MQDVRSITKPSFSVGTALAVLAAILFAVASAGAQCPTPGWVSGDGLPGVGGHLRPTGEIGHTIRASVMWDADGSGPLPAKLVVGGMFEHAGSDRSYGVAMWDGTSWRPLGTGLIVADASQGQAEVTSLAVGPDGELYAGGYISENGDGSPLGTTPSPASDQFGFYLTGLVARFDGATWHRMGTGLYGVSVEALAVRPNGHVIAGGLISGINDENNIESVLGTRVNSIVRWDGSNWHSIDQGVRFDGDPGLVTAMTTLPNGDVVVAGAFNQAGPTTANNIALLHFAADGTTSTWFAMGGVAPEDSFIHVLAMPNGDVVATTISTTIAGTPVDKIGRWNGSVWTNMGTGLSSPLEHLSTMTLASNGDIVAIGEQTNSNVVEPRVMVRLHDNTWTQTTIPRTFFEQSTGGSMQTLVEMPNGDIAAGSMVVKNGIIRWDGAAWSHFGAGFNDSIFDLVKLPNGDIVASGDFTQAGNVSAKKIARFDGTTWSPLGEGQPWGSLLLPLSNNELLTLGVDEAFSIEFSRWNGTAWTLLPTPPFNINNVSQALVAPNDDIIVVLSSVSHSLWRYSTTNGWTEIPGVFEGFGSPEHPFTSPSSVAVMPNGDIVVGGLFQSVDGTPAQNVATWNGTSWSALGGGLGSTSIGDAVNKLLVLPNGKIMAAEGFTLIGGTTQQSRVAIWDGTTWTDASAGLAPYGVNSGVILDLQAMPSGDVIAAGEVRAPGTPSDLGAPFAVWNGATWTLVGDPVTGIVRKAVAMNNGNVAIGGDFRRVDNVGLSNFAIYGCDGCPADFNHSGTLDSQDFFDFIAAFFAALPSADFNADGAVNSQDFFDFLAAFFAGC